MKIKELDIIKPWHKQDLGGKRPDKSVCIVRYGGFGDLIQASSILPWFKDNGWYVTVNTEHRGFDIIKNDPHIDEIFLQHKGQIPNRELDAYWSALGKNFTKFVQLSESVEKTLLTVKGQPEYDMTTKERHRKLNVNYFHRIHEIAGADLPPKPFFYPTKAEERWAIKERRSMGFGNFVILWVLSGSSIHKAYPYTDRVVAHLMLRYPSARIVFVGDGLCQILEEAWRKEKRVYRRSNRWSIRETLTFAQYADVVFGPETGVLNSVGYTDIPKVIMLSHSSPVNIAGDWPNTQVLMPENTDCYPCHKMHYTRSTCNWIDDDERFGAACCVNIESDRVINAITGFMEKRKAA